MHELFSDRSDLPGVENIATGSFAPSPLPEVSIVRQADVGDSPPPPTPEYVSIVASDNRRAPDAYAEPLPEPPSVAGEIPPDTPEEPASPGIDFEALRAAGFTVTVGDTVLDAYETADKPAVAEPVKVSEPENGQEEKEVKLAFRAMGPLRHNPEFGEKFTAFIQRERAKPYANEQPATRVEKVMIEGARKALVTLGEELGIDLNKQLPSPAHYHFFDTEQAMYEAVRQRWGEKQAEAISDATGYHSREGSILWVANNNITINWSNIAHETVHAASLSRVYLTNPETKGISLETGYANLSQGLNETVTDMAANRIMGIIGTGESRQAYHGLNLLSDGLVRKTADFHNKEPREAANALMKGMFDGDMAGLRMMSQTFGRNMRLILGLRGDTSIDDAQAVAQQLGLAATVEKFERFKDKSEYQVFDW